MYLHIGKGKTLNEKDIIGIFDLDTATVSKETREFLNKKEKEGLTEYADFDLPRSFVVCKEKKKRGVYKIVLSRISTLGLRDRAEGFNEEE